MKNTKKYKLNPKFLVLVGVVVCIIVAVIIMLNSNNNPENKPQTPPAVNNDYSAAHAKTNALESYEMRFSTLVTVNDGELKQTAIDQVLKKTSADGSLIYMVDSSSNSTDSTNGNTVSEKSSYTYYKGDYYYALPGVKYRSHIGEDGAKANLENFKNVIAFPYEKMYNLTVEDVDGGTDYYYDVEYEDVSDYVKAVCASAVNIVGEGNFERSAGATATVKDGYVVQRTLFVDCVNENGASVTVEFVTDLTAKDAQIPVPDKDKYPNIAG